MKKILAAIIVFCAGLLMRGISAPQSIRVSADAANWTAIGPEGGDIRDLVCHPSNNSILYALAGGYPSQIFRSNNGGLNWARLAALSESTYDIAIDPLNGNNLFILGSSRIYKSSDGGATWNAKNLPNYNYGSSGEITVSRSNPNVVYACGYYVYDTSNWKYRPAAFKSTDGGESWSSKPIYSGSPSYSYTYSLAVDPNNADIVYAGIYYYTGSSAVFQLMKSTDGGSAWTDKTGIINAQIDSLVIDPTNPSKVYAGTTWGIFRSADGGNTWAKNIGYVYAYALAIDPSNPNTLYAGYIKECSKSTDGGVNWTCYQGVVLGNCNAMLANGNRVFYASSAGIFRSDNSGGNWQGNHSGLIASQIPAICLAPSSPNVIYVEVADNALFKSTDSGTNWTRMPEFARCESVSRICVNPTNPNDLYILAGG